MSEAENLQGSGIGRKFPNTKGFFGQSGTVLRNLELGCVHREKRTPLSLDGLDSSANWRAKDEVHSGLMRLVGPGLSLLPAPKGRVRSPMGSETVGLAIAGPCGPKAPEVLAFPRDEPSGLASPMKNLTHS